MTIFSFLHSVKSVPKVSWSSKKALNLKPRFPTLTFLLLGLTLFGIGESILIASGIGVSPWTVLAQGVSNYTNWSIGFSTFVLSVGVLLIWIPLKQKPGLGTILNIVLISIIIDLSTPILPYPKTFLFQTGQSIIAVFIVGLGSGFYLTANLGPGPRDGLMTGLQNLTNQPIALIRTIIEVSAVCVGFYLGGVVGIGTLLFAFGIGPTVSIGIFIVMKYFK